MGHPIRNEPINVWAASDSQGPPKWLAKYGTGRVFPIFFEGETEEEVREKAETFRADVIARNEAQFLARQQNLEKARASKGKRKSPVGAE